MRTFRLLALGAFFILSLSLPLAFADEESSPAIVESDDTVEVDVPPAVDDVVDAPETDDDDAEEEPEPVVDTAAEEAAEAEAAEAEAAEAEAAAKAENEAAAAKAEEEEVEALLKESEELSVPVSFIKDTVLSKVTEITSKISITKENAKKTAAFALGTWGAATGVGWAVQQMGVGKQE